MQVLINITVAASVYLAVSCSFSLVFLPTRIFHLAQGAIITLGSYLVFLFAFQLSLPFAISVVLALLGSILCGVLCELLSYRPMRRLETPPWAFLISSIGLYAILQGAISLIFGGETKNIRIGEASVGREIFGAYISDIQIITIAISAVLFVAVNLFLQFTTVGKSIRAVSSNPQLCDIYGIDSNRVILTAFVIGSALAAVAGILSAMDTDMTPTFGFNLLLYGVVAMIIGGVGSRKGLVGGALLVATTQHSAAYYMDTQWVDAVTYFILILFLIWKPLGFSGKELRKVEI